MTSQEILDLHQQLRSHTCFQMAPELALKLAGILEPQDYPFQGRVEWDGKGYSVYTEIYTFGQFDVEFEEIQYLYPYDGLIERLRQEISAGAFPILSLMEQGQSSWHGYVGVEVLGDSDVRLLTKAGSLESQCRSHTSLLSNCTWNQLKVDCLFWRATERKEVNPIPSA